MCMYIYVYIIHTHAPMSVVGAYGVEAGEQRDPVSARWA